MASIWIELRIAPFFRKDGKKSILTIGAAAFGVSDRPFKGILVFTQVIQQWADMLKRKWLTQLFAHALRYDFVGWRWKTLKQRINLNFPQSFFPTLEFNDFCHVTSLCRQPTSVRGD